MKIVAKALVLDEAGNVLLLRRSNTHPNYPLHYDFPGGEVEIGESHNDAVKREIKEETGLEVALAQLKNVYRQQITDGVANVVYMANISGDRPSVELSWEHSGFEWIPFDTLPSVPIPDGVDDYHLTVLEYLQQM